MTGFEVVAFIKSIPGGAAALARVIGSPVSALAAWVDIATAEGESRAREIRIKSQARAKVIAAMGGAAAKQFEDDEGLAQRALEHFADDLVDKQINCEIVATKAIGYLREEPPRLDAGEVSADWINVFSSFCKNASSDKMREHWAAILAGEIRRPSTVSLFTLHLMSIVDQEIATLIDKYSRYCFSESNTYALSIDGLFGAAPIYDDLLKLDAVGFLVIGAHSVDGTEFMIGSDFKITCKSSDMKVATQAAILTKAGAEIINLVGVKPTVEDAKFVFEAIKSSFVGGADSLELSIV